MQDSQESQRVRLRFCKGVEDADEVVEAPETEGVVRVIVEFVFEASVKLCVADENVDGEFKGFL